MLSESEQWWCTEYAEDIHYALKKRECDRINLEFNAPQIEYRMHVIQYMLDIAQRQKFSRTTLHLAVYYLDVFMDNHTIRFWRLHLVALTSLRIAAKIEEKDFTLARVDELDACGDFMRNDYNTLETIMLKLFDWDVNIPTTATFGSYYAEFITDERDFTVEIHNSYKNFDDFKKAIKSDVMHFIDKSIFDVTLQHGISPSKLASMCLAAARYQWNLEPIWPSRLRKVTQFSWECIKYDFQRLLNIEKRPREQLEAELEVCVQAESMDVQFD